jgi:cytochrome c peroxidase
MEAGPPLPRGLPSDLWELLVPPENPVMPERVALGRKLYFDKRLSKDSTGSCATCHDPAKGFSDGKKVSEGIGGQERRAQRADGERRSIAELR